MCQRKSTPPKKKKGKQKSTVSLKPSRKTRTKRRKPKYLSLSLKLSPQKNPQSSNKKIKMTQKKKQQQLQLNLFPLHPELNLVEDHNRDMHEDNNVVASFLFDTATDSTTTLDDLLTSTNTTATTTSEEGPRSPPSLTYSYTRGRENNYGGDSNGLVRTAMRCKERDASEERWVSYSEVVESKKIKEEEEESSCVDDADDDAGAWCVKQVQKRRLLLDLKLDYQEVMNAWSDKGSLYVDGEFPQTVPELRDPNIPIDAWSLWSVPEMTSNVGSLNVDDELGCKEGWKRSEHREASVLRYKEKRQNRLFSKRIRYEVRKLNAEKRPRMKMGEDREMSTVRREENNVIEVGG